MQRLAVIMSHASRSMGGAVREVTFCAALRKLGVEARIWRMHPGAATEREEIEGVPVSFCPVDDATVHVHRQVSAVLRAEIASFAPDIVLYKGLSYAVNVDVQASRPAGSAYGLIVGGATKDPLVEGAAIVFGEYREQLQRHFPAHLAAGRAMVMPKHVDLALAGDGRPPRDPEFDIVNVGTFAEPRKNQAALLPFGERHRIAFVGGGPPMLEMRKAARQQPNIRFLGRLPHAEVFDVIRRSRIMVHPSTLDGLPRATVEAMATGRPVIALRDTIEGGIPVGAGLLVSAAALPHAVEMLLADEGMCHRMGRFARRYVERHHGPAAIAAAAAEALRLLRAQ
jgi:glycosyltransferase involved in cell wall biosynthesis